MNNFEVYMGFGFLFTFIFNDKLINSIQNRIEETRETKQKLPDGNYVNDSLVFIISYIICVIVWPLTFLDIISNNNN